MVHRHVMGREGMTLAAIASMVMAAVAFFVGIPGTLMGGSGICLPSPNEWGLNALWGWILNLGILVAVTLTLYAANRQFTFVQGSDTVLTGMFVIMATSNVWVSGMLSTSAIMALANIVSLLILFGCYRSRNATQEIFVIATILGLGSMIQYSFIFMLPVYLIGAILMKCFNVKVLCAFVMGICAPYWVGLGLGIITLEEFRMPEFTNIFEGYASKSGIFFGLLNIAVSMSAGLLLALNNGVKLYAGNTQRRLYNVVINLLGIVVAICMILDFNNLIVYLVTAYMVVAVQLGNLFALWSIHRGWIWILSISLCYIAGFIMMVN